MRDRCAWSQLHGRQPCRSISRRYAPRQERGERVSLTTWTSAKRGASEATAAASARSSVPTISEMLQPLNAWTIRSREDALNYAAARNIPLDELPGRLAELQDHKQHPIRLLCRTDRRSAQAARLLAEAGFVDAQVIRGGMTAWRAKGWPVVDARK